MTARVASCRCGKLTATCEGDPDRISVCHCLACQRRSGSAFAAQARFPVDCVTITGSSAEWISVADSGNEARFHFCPTCGSTVHFAIDAQPDMIAIPLGAFADPNFPAPRFSVWEERKHSWVKFEGDEVEHID